MELYPSRFLEKAALHLAQAPKAAKSPNSVGHAREALRTPWKLPEPDGSEKASRAEQAKKSPAKHKQSKKRSLGGP